MDERIIMILSLIFCFFICGISIADCVYYSRMKDSKASNISSGVCTAMMYLNIVLAVISFATAIILIILLCVKHHGPDDYQKALNKCMGIADNTKKITCLARENVSEDKIVEIVKSQPPPPQPGVIHPSIPIHPSVPASYPFYVYPTATSPYPTGMYPGAAPPYHVGPSSPR